MIDKKLSDILAHEQQRQSEGLELIASENYVSKDVMHAYANIFTNKYSEGYPGARYYGGNEFVDDLERYTQYRALKMFGLIRHPEQSEGSHEALNDKMIEGQNDIIPSFSNSVIMSEAISDRGVNVQPLSGSPANLAVYMGVLKPGDTVLAMDLNAGGHLSHGHKLNASAMYYNFISYGLVRETYDIDYDDIRSKALEYKPAMIVAGFSAYPKTIDWKRFAAIADEVSKTHGYRPLLMADIAHIAGLIAGESLSSPFPYFDIITTTTHKTLRGPRGALIYMRRDNRDLEKKINRGVFPGLQGGPHEHVIYAKAVAFDEVLQPSFKAYAKKVIENAKVLASELVALGWPVLTGTTENHIVLMDVTHRSKGQNIITPEYEQTFKNYCDNYENYIETIKKYEESYDALHEWIKSSLDILPPSATIFEIGSGTGRDAAYIETLGYSVQRSEIIPGFIDVLQQGGNSVTQYNPIYEPLAGKYHAIISRGGFAHHNYNQLSQSLRNIASGLHTGGMLIFDVKYGEGEGMMVSGGKSFERFFKHWLEEELQKLLQENGYELVEIVVTNDKKRVKIIAKYTKDITEIGLTGKIAELVLEKIGISVNKNLLPFDTRSPMDPSGLRLGTPAITTRGLGTDEMKLVAGIISRALENYNDEFVLEELKNEVKELCKKFPLAY